ncbi:MAG: hypothetical protein QXV17_14615 [Candidatus Micrarchaeaceae archaeon]
MSEEKKIKMETWSEILETVRDLRDTFIEEFRYTDNPILRKKIVTIIEVLNILVDNITEYLEMRKRESRRVKRWD